MTQNALFPFFQRGFFHKCLFAGLLLLAAGNARLLAADPGPDMSRIKAQMREYILQPTPQTTEEVSTPSSDRQVQQWVASLGPDGDWGDIRYQDQSPSFWAAADHLSRTRAMAKAYVAGTASGRPDPALRTAILRALDYWLQKDYRNRNWWQNEIGVPRAMGDILLLMQADLSPGELDAGTKIMSRAVIGRTGQNKVWQSGVVLARALLQNDPALARQARDAIVGELVVTTGDGIQPDFSFHQHGPDLQTGNYGLAFAASLEEWAQVLRGTDLALDGEKQQLLRNFLLDGESPFVWNGVLDISACGRQLFPTAPARKGGALLQVLGRMPEIDPQSADAYQAVIMRNRFEAGLLAQTINTHFWRSDIMVQRLETAYLSVKMCSRRVIGSECVNAENLQGYHLADGATYLYQTGHEYEDIFPVWDWRKLPGVTCAQTSGPLPRLTIDSYHLDTDFAGGVSDGAYGAAALDYARDGLSGKKSWFFFEGEAVCLGAGFRTDQAEDVTTSINQCLLHGSVTVSDGKSLTTPAAGQTNYSHLQWVHHDGVGYVFPDAMKVTVAAQAQHGTWKSIYSAGSADPVTKNVFSLWIDHGIKPQEARYSYILLPSVSVAQVQVFAQKLDVEIVSNTPALQAVRNANLHMTQAVFYQPGQISDTAGKRIAVDSPCLMMVQETDAGPKITVADPTQKLLSMVVTVGSVTKQIALPSGPNAGRSVKGGF